MTIPTFTNSFFERNRTKLASKLLPKSIVILHSNDEMPKNGDQFYPFRQNSDFYYLTGIPQKKSILVLFPNHIDKKYREILFITQSNPKLELWNGKLLTTDDAKNISGIQTIFWVENFESMLSEIIFSASNVYLNSNENPRFESEVEIVDRRFARHFIEKYPFHKLERLAPLLTELRLIKEPEEITIIKHACDITAQAFRRILKFTKPNVNELEIEAEISHEFRIKGAQGHAYYPIVASGINACCLHYNENNSICQSGELLLLDFGAEYLNYAADCSRTIPVNGHFTPRQKELYNATLRVFKQAKALMVKGTTIAEINKAVGLLWEEEHIQLGLYSKDDVIKQDKDNPLYTKYFPHGIGHFLGLDVHDVGSKHVVLQAGMVLTCEPGIYIPEESVGIRIENNIVITEAEPIDLMEMIPVELEEIERLMN